MLITISEGKLELKIIWVFSVKITGIFIGENFIFFNTEEVHKAADDYHLCTFSPYVTFPVNPTSIGYSERINRRIRHFQLNDWRIGLW